MPNRPRRLAGFSYRGKYRYFVTVCTYQRQAFLQTGEAAAWLTDQIQQVFEPMQFAVIAFCVMPDHVHLLLEGLTDDADFRRAMRLWKLRTGFAWKQRTECRLWQESFYDYVLRRFDSVPGIAKYIVDNPISSGRDSPGTRKRRSNGAL